MIRKYHNHKLQTNPWHREEEPHNHHETPGRQTKQSNQLSLPHQDDAKLEGTQRNPKEENDCRNYFTINLQESMGSDRTQTCDLWIYS